ncbi:hypothetical protein MRX96_003771 [Rhipicephalus microplus]
MSAGGREMGRRQPRDRNGEDTGPASVHLRDQHERRRCIFVSLHLLHQKASPESGAKQGRTPKALSPHRAHCHLARTPRATDGVSLTLTALAGDEEASAPAAPVREAEDPGVGGAQWFAYSATAWPHCACVYAHPPRSRIPPNRFASLRPEERGRSATKRARSAAHVAQSPRSLVAMPATN